MNNAYKTTTKNIFNNKNCTRISFFSLVTLRRSNIDYGKTGLGNSANQC
jgi:hypothetical protein